MTFYRQVVAVPPKRRTQYGIGQGRRHYPILGPI